MNSDKVTFYVLAMTAGLVAGVGDALLNKWAKTSGGSFWWVFGGIACWNVALVGFLLLLARGLLAHAVVLFLLTNVVAVLLLSRYVFNEELSTQKWLGITLAVLAVILMELDSR